MILFGGCIPGVPGDTKLAINFGCDAQDFLLFVAYPLTSIAYLPIPQCVLFHCHAVGIFLDLIALFTILFALDALNPCFYYYFEKRAKSAWRYEW